MHSQIQNDEIDKMCWVINLERKTIKLEFLEYKKYSSFTFLDPAKNIFGFTLLRPKSYPTSPHKIITLQGNRYQTGSNIQHSTFRGTPDRYQERQLSKQPMMPVKKSLNLNEKTPSRKISSSSAGSPSYKNQLGLFRKQQTAKEQVSPTTSDLGNRQHNRTYKVNNYFPSKKSVADNDYLSASFHNSQLRLATTDRSNPRNRGTLTPNSTREIGSVGQERFYKKVKDIIRK